METYLTLPVLFYVAGVATRALLPWLIKIVNQLRSEEQKPVAWQWRYLAGQATVGVIVLLVTPLLVSDVTTITDAAPFVSWTAGFTVAAIGRQLDKLITNS